MTTPTELVAKSREYVSRYFAEATFQQFLAIFEEFVFDLLRLWLAAYPANLNKKTLIFEEVVAAGDVAAVTRLVVDRELNEVLYKRPAEWFAYLEAKAKLGRPTADEVGRFAEAKATRDALAHGTGVVTKAYLAKAGPFARYVLGQFVEVPEPYHRAIWVMLCTLVAKVSDAAMARVV